MSNGPRIETERLVLRRWQPEDLDPFASLNADPTVMEHFPATMTRRQTEQMILRIQQGFEVNGFGLWALEAKADRSFVGFCGLSEPSFQAHFMPAVEVGWRLAKEYWGHGYATESAAAAVTFGFTEARLAEIVSFTIPENERSIAVMERLGMSHDRADDFDHPLFMDDDRLRRHVLYRLEAGRWLNAKRG